MMKISFSTLGTPYYNIDQIIDIAVQNKYQGIEIRAVKGTSDIAGLDEFRGSGLKDTCNKIKSAGLKVVCVGTSIRFNRADKADQEKNLELAKRYIDIAIGLDCSYIRTFGGPLVATQGYTESMKWAWEGYNKLCELTKGTNVIPLIETHDDFSTSARIMDLISGISNGKVGVIWDILHPYRFGEAVENTYNVLKDLIYHVHIKDSANYSSTGFDITLIGEGKVPISKCISLLKDNGYEGYLSFEWEKLWHPEIPEPEIAIPHFASNIVKFIQ